MNGARLEGRRMEVSFAKYANKGLHHKGLAQVVSGREAEQIGGRSKGKLNDKDERSFKEVVERFQQKQKTDEWRSKNDIEVIASWDDEEWRRPVQMRSNETRTRWNAKTTSSIKVEEIKRSLTTLLHLIEQSVEVENPRCRRERSIQQKEGEAGQRRFFQEEELLTSMMNRRCDSSLLPISEFESSCPINHIFPDVGPTKESVKEVNLPQGPRLDLISSLGS